jgi:hypothetical protein
VYSPLHCITSTIVQHTSKQASAAHGHHCAGGQSGSEFRLLLIASRTRRLDATSPELRYELCTSIVWNAAAAIVSAPA